MVAMIAAAAPAPQPNESHADFVIRAHGQLITAIPEPAERNRVVWNAWDAARGNAEQQRAQAKFSPDQYQRFPDVCYFSEHEANSVGADGNPMVRKYDAAKLREIIEENNLRIADVDAYPTIIDRHTAPAGTRDPSAPETLGVAGPFRLGMIGRISPRFAIFTDEYVRKDKLPKMADKGGRSVEVLTMKSTGRSYINPIAAISEAPRLPLPVQFSFGAADDEIVERYSVAQYSAGVPAFAGGGNTFVQKFDTQSPDGDSQASSTNPGDGQMNEQLVRQIIEALMSTEQMQWVTQQMGSGGTPAGGAAPQPAAPATPPQQPQQFGGGMMGGGMMGPMGQQARYQTAESFYMPTEGDEDLAERYQALASGQQQLVNELAETRSQLAHLAVAKADADRSSRLRELASRMPIDLEAELQACLYSAGSDYDDARFEAHIDTVERYAAKSIEQMPMVPTGVTNANAPNRDTAQYQAQESAMIKTLINEYANKGISKPYPELKTEAQKRLGTAS